MSDTEEVRRSSSRLNTPNHEDKKSDDEKEDSEIYEVEKILKHRFYRGKRQFLVRWKGYSESEDSWEPKENLEGASDVLNKYLASVKGGSKEKEKSRKDTKNDSRSCAANPSYVDVTDEEMSSDDNAPPEKRKKTSKKGTSLLKKPNECSSGGVAEITIAKEVARRAKMAKGLRWITESSDDSEVEMYSGGLTARARDGVADTSTNAAVPKPNESNSLSAVSTITNAKVEEVKTDTSALNTNGNHKEKKEEKHSKSDKNSGRKGASNSKASSSSSLPSKRSSLTFEGIYRHNDNQLRFVGVDEKTQKREIYTMGEAYVADAWNLVRYLSSKVKFKESGVAHIDGNSKQQNT